MALEKTQLIELAKATAKAALNPSLKYSVNIEGAEGKVDLTADSLSKTFTKELDALGGSKSKFRENANLIYSLLEVTLSEYIPAKVLSTYGQFADIKRYAQGDKPVFKVKISEASRKRAKQFVTKVGLAGRYETFKLDGYTIEVPTSAYGGAARIEWEEMAQGKITLSDYFAIVLEGIDEAIYREVAKALKAAAVSLKAVNKVVSNGFDEVQMDRLLATADAYGKSTIYCTFEFAATMLPIASGATNWNAMSDAMKDQIWNNGAFTTYKGHSVIILPQSFEDETNAKKVIDPSLCYIIPTGSEKPVKIAFEGDAQVASFDNRDWSTEMQTYQKIGVATYMVNPGLCVFQNTALSINNVPANNTTIV